MIFRAETGNGPKLIHPTNKRVIKFYNIPMPILFGSFYVYLISSSHPMS